VRDEGLPEILHQAFVRRVFGRHRGLIAEEVAEIYPELVVRDKERQPGVRYPVLPAMLLNELQRQERRLQAQDAKLAAQQQEIDELRAQVRALIRGRAAVRE
jgi:septal ring factor EnvC (AmiA/AmiB activator)